MKNFKPFASLILAITLACGVSACGFTLDTSTDVDVYDFRAGSPQ